MKLLAIFEDFDGDFRTLFRTSDYEEFMLTWDRTEGGYRLREGCILAGEELQSRLQLAFWKTRLQNDLISMIKDKIEEKKGERLKKEYCELSKSSDNTDFQKVLDSAFSLTFVEMLDAVQELDEPINVKICLLDFHKKLHAHESFIF